MQLYLFQVDQTKYRLRVWMCQPQCAVLPEAARGPSPTAY